MLNLNKFIKPSLLFLFWILANFVIAQRSFEMEPFLKAAFNDRTLKSYQLQTKFLEQNNYNFPLLHRVELRIGNEEYTETPNQFRVRLSPSNPAEIKANKKYYNKQLTSINSRQQIALSDVLYNRYLLIIELAVLLELKELTENQINSQVELSGKIDNSLVNLKLKDVIALQSNQTKFLLSKEEIESKIIETNYFIKSHYPGMPEKVDSISNLIQVSEIKKYLKYITAEDNLENVRIAALRNQLELDEQKLEIEKAEARGNIGYIQSNFDDGKNGNFNQKLAFQVGIRLPIVNPDKPKINRLKVDLLEEKTEVKNKIELLNERSILNNELLNRMIIRHELILERVKIAKEITISRGGNIDWEQIIDLKNYQYSLEAEKIKSEKNIRKQFIDFLNTKGYLVKSPVINYLSNNFVSIN